MEFGEYVQKAEETAFYPEKGYNLVYTVLGLCGEAGEVSNSLKKLIRDRRGESQRWDGEFLEKITDELGDILWYLAACSWELGIPLDTIAKMNINKLESRKQRNKLSGNGDKR